LFVVTLCYCVALRVHCLLHRYLLHRCILSCVALCVHCLYSRCVALHVHCPCIHRLSPPGLPIDSSNGNINATLGGNGITTNRKTSSKRGGWQPWMLGAVVGAVAFACAGLSLAFLLRKRKVMCVLGC